ncbi:ABC transporter ATP-binding protein/permease [Ruminococcaceae bacterium OttesenSCG-928-L11]|nr:ABC transporter ATP-binding protein/permease [Ruminococcaceae bacterium OttesenSCG-928-L11]
MARGGHGHFNEPGLTAEDLKKNPPAISVSLLKRIFRYLLPYWPYMAVALLAIAFSTVFDLLPSILTGKIIDEGFLAGNFRRLLYYVGISFGVLLASNLIALLQTYVNAWVAQHISKDMRNQLYAHLQKMSQRFFADSKQGDIITRMTSDVSGVEQVISGTLAGTVANVALLVSSLAAMFSRNWILAAVGMLIIPLFILPTKKVGKRRWALTLQSQKKSDAINQVLNETLSVSGQQLVKLFTNEERELETYTRLNGDMLKLRIRESMVGRWFHMAINTFSSIGPMLIYLVAGILMLEYGDASLTIGDVTVMIALLNRMYRPVNQLLEVQVDFVRAMALFTRIFDYLDMPVEIESRPDAITPDSLRGDVSFENVSFRYKADTPVLENVSFTAKAGTTIAIVGPSGAGKSTMVSLLTRLYDVTDGCIRLDSHDIRDLDLSFLRRQIGVVTQDNYLFNGTIRENLLYANQSATAEELEKACREANIHEFIAGLPQGYDTLVGNRGMKLSGGERQRLSIARVILKDPALLILDEATSSLDSISESLIQSAIEPLLENRTSIVIAHRLSTVMSADEILVVCGGRIVEQGTHQALLRDSSVYRDLYETQFERVLREYRAS